MNKIVLTKDQQNRIQQLELEVLIEFDKICRRHNLKYTLAGGTLLGAVRHDGFIPWDDDVDVTMLRKDYEKFTQVYYQELNDRLFFQSKDTDPQYQYPFSKVRIKDTIFKETFLAKYNINHGVYIDVFPIDNVYDDENKRVEQINRFRHQRRIMMGKYLDPAARSGNKRILAYLTKVCFFWDSFDRIHDQLNRISNECNESDTKFVCSLTGIDPLKEVFPREYHDEVVDHNFEGHKLNIMIKSYHQCMVTI